MNKSDRQSVAQMSAGFADTVQAIINRSCFIDYGIIKDKPASGVVTVEVSVAKNSNDIKLITCVLANISSSTFTLDVVPEVGDKVLVVYPRRYSDDMFDVDNNEAIIEETASGYNLLSGIAILVNQYRKNQHHNFIQVKDGEISINMAYDKQNKKNKAVFTLDKTGKLKYQSGNNWIQADLSDTNGKITLSDSNNHNIVSTSASTKINGHLEIK